MCAQRVGEASNPGPKNKKATHPSWPSFMVTFLDEADPIALHLARIESRGLWRWQSAGKRRRASSDRGTPREALQHWIDTYREEINEESILHIEQCLRQATSHTALPAPAATEPRLRITGKQSPAQTPMRACPSRIVRLCHLQRKWRTRALCQPQGRRRCLLHHGKFLLVMRLPSFRSILSHSASPTQ